MHTLFVNTKPIPKALKILDIILSPSRNRTWQTFRSKQKRTTYVRHRISWMSLVLFPKLQTHMLFLQNPAELPLPRTRCRLEVVDMRSSLCCSTVAVNTRLRYPVHYEKIYVIIKNLYLCCRAGAHSKFLRTYFPTSYSIISTSTGTAFATA